jgi:hypothetical protein
MTVPLAKPSFRDMRPFEEMQPSQGEYVTRLCNGASTLMHCVTDAALEIALQKPFDNVAAVAAATVASLTTRRAERACED